MNTRIAIAALMSLSLESAPVQAAVFCDGTVTRVLSGNVYCANGERVGFMWTGNPTTWVCSSNKNMDALIMMAYATGKPISVRDNTWTTCSPPTASVPEHVWFIE
jgi:hypothetical protein